MDIIENIECEFSINQKLKIIKGLYSGNVGRLSHYDSKKELYHIEIIVENKKLLIGCKIADLKEDISFLPWKR